MAETPQGIRHFHLDHLGTPRLISALGRRRQPRRDGQLLRHRVVERIVSIATAPGGPESASTTTETYDRQGRLWKVTGAADAQVTTTYSYDVGNRLRQVQTQDGATSQNRFFVYDYRGFLTSETHPEKGRSATAPSTTPGTTPGAMWGGRPSRATRATPAT